MPTNGLNQNIRTDAEALRAAAARALANEWATDPRWQGPGPDEPARTYPEGRAPGRRHAGAPWILDLIGARNASIAAT